MKRKPKSSQGEETKQTILLAAVQIVLSQGVDSLNTNNVAKKAGVSVGTLYQYFNNKDEILLELLLAGMERRMQKVKEAVTLSMAFKSAKEIIDRLIDALFEMESAEYEKLEFLLFPWALANQPKAALKMAQRNRESIHPLIKLLLVTKEPSLKNRDIDAISFILLQAVRGTVVGRTMPEGKDLSESALKRELKHLFLAMVVSNS